jgi:hypothetical protein
MPAKTQREREAQQRQAKLDRINEQVEEGSLVIRQMTDEERARFGQKRVAPAGTESRRERRRRPRSSARAVPPGPRR